MKGLIIREPWIGMILAGRKTWEMRSKQTPYRGRVGLIRQGSGTVVGVAEIIGSPPALDPASLRATRDWHGIPPDRDAEVLNARWICPWVLADVRALKRPVLAGQKPGAVTWVTLSPVLISRIEELCGWIGVASTAEAAQ